MATSANNPSNQGSSQHNEANSAAKPAQASGGNCHSHHHLPFQHTRLGLADDITLITSTRVLAQSWPTLVEELAATGHTVVPHKCSFWAPVADHAYAEDPLAVRDHPARGPMLRLQALIPRSMGLKLLGSTASGAYHTHSHFQ